MGIRSNESGQSIVTFMIALAALATIAAFALPKVFASRIADNEAAAQATLARISSAQREVRTSGRLDSDNNGIGEYGYFQELTGQRPHRLDSNGNGFADAVADNTLVPPLLEAEYRTDNDGLILRSGYYFRMYLPGFMNVFRSELAPTLRYNFVRAQSAEKYWACIAWPVDAGRTGNRVFFINQTGILLAADNSESRYSGMEHPPHIDGVLPLGSRGHGMMSSSVAVNTTGKDNNYWMTVE